MKLFVYDNAKPHVHDNMAAYVNTVPLSKIGIEQHFEITKIPTEADYFYMGQIANETFTMIGPQQFEFYKEHKDRHICDIEGEGGMPIPNWLHDAILTTMGPLKIYSNIKKLFARPTFSHLLVDIIKNRNEKFELPTQKSFGFRGFLNHRMRAMTVHSLHNSDFEKELHINRVWNGPSDIGGKVQNDYIQTMSNNLLSLCPRGSGIDSVRLIETCYYNRVPILISDYDYYLVGETSSELDFVYRITGHDLTPDKITEQLQKIYDTPIDELHDRANAARKYFDTTIRKYFNDPTKYFLEWLEENER